MYIVRKRAKRNSRKLPARKRCLWARLSLPVSAEGVNGEKLNFEEKTVEVI